LDFREFDGCQIIIGMKKKGEREKEGWGRKVRAPCSLEQRPPLFSSKLI